jgi:hypothetical protein
METKHDSITKRVTTLSYRCLGGRSKKLVVEMGTDAPRFHSCPFLLCLPQIRSLLKSNVCLCAALHPILLNILNFRPGLLIARP